MATEQTSARMRRVLGYCVAAVVGGLLSLLLLRFVMYVNAPYVRGGSSVLGCRDLGRFWWTIPLVTWLVALVLAIYLARSTSPGPAPEPAQELRCLACGQRVFHDWRICPYCGGLTGKTRHAGDDEGA